MLGAGSAHAAIIFPDLTDNGSGIQGTGGGFNSVGGIDVSRWNVLDALSGGFAGGACESVVAIKKTDDASAEIANAVISGKAFQEITASFFANDPSTGATYRVFEIRLHGAVIERMDIDAENSSEPLQERLTIVPQSISIVEDNGGMTIVSCGKIK